MARRVYSDLTIVLARRAGADADENGPIPKAVRSRWKREDEEWEAEKRRAAAEGGAPVPKTRTAKALEAADRALVPRAGARTGTGAGSEVGTTPYAREGVSGLRPAETLAAEPLAAILDVMPSEVRAYFLQLRAAGDLPSTIKATLDVLLAVIAAKAPEASFEQLVDAATRLITRYFRITNPEAGAGGAAGFTSPFVAVFQQAIQQQQGGAP